MSSALVTTAHLVAGPAHDPQLALADGTPHRLRFFSDLPTSLRVLDVGCGNGQHLRELAGRGCRVVGVEPSARAVRALCDSGLDVLQGTAESLPVEDGSFDAIVCSVVVPYTDERRAIAEWARVLAPRGQVRASYHGLGFALGQVLQGPGLRRRVYGARTIVNSWCYRLTGRRLPGFWGDTLYQSAARLARYYREAGLTLLGEYVRPAYGLRDVFFHHLQKAD
jgi:SAM-dependent methyltransferase